MGGRGVGDNTRGSVLSVCQPVAKSRRGVLRAVISSVCDRFIGAITSKEHVRRDHMEDITSKQVLANRRTVRLKLISTVKGCCSTLGCTKNITKVRKSDMPIGECSMKAS